MHRKSIKFENDQYCNGFDLAISTLDMKVVSTPTMVRNGAGVPVDGLEKSIIETTPFRAFFRKYI
ncbi:MAG: hypothetical protein WBB23_08730 [Desulforhopalus sp.]